MGQSLAMLRMFTRMLQLVGPGRTLAFYVSWEGRHGNEMRLPLTYEARGPEYELKKKKRFQVERLKWGQFMILI